MSREIQGEKIFRGFVKSNSHRKLQPAYGYLYLYRDCPHRKIQEKIDLALKEYTDNGGQELRKNALSIRFGVIRKMYNEEPGEVRARVEQYCANVNRPGYDKQQEFGNHPPEEALRLGRVLKARRYLLILKSKDYSDGLRRTAESFPHVANAFLKLVGRHKYKGIIALVGPDVQDPTNQATSIV